VRPQGLQKEFFVIGENIHATRVLLRGGKNITGAPSGEEAIRYTDRAGETRSLIIPEEFKRRQDYQEGRVKHVGVAVRAAMSESEPAAGEGREYLSLYSIMPICVTLIPVDSDLAIWCCMMSIKVNIVKRQKFSISKSNYTHTHRVVSFLSREVVCHLPQGQSP